VARIAAPLSDTDLRAQTQVVRRYADIVELRIDRFARHEPSYVADVCRAARDLGLPLIATVRAASQGGAVDLSDAQRLAAFEAALPLVDAVDLELRSALCAPLLARAAHGERLAIVSHHDFSATPSDADLAALFDDATLPGAGVLKIAGHAATAGDADRLLGFLLARRARGLIVIAMGPHGVASRVFFPLLGSLITYGFAGQAGAPGQLPLAELHAQLRRYSPEFAAAHPD
jgi:3-dehydroquinate dehydratase-1